MSNEPTHSDMKNWQESQELKGRDVHREGELRIIANTPNGPVDVTEILTSPEPGF